MRTDWSGSVTPFTPSVDFSEQYWLEVIIDGKTMKPRYRLSAIPYTLSIPDNTVLAKIGDISGKTQFILTREKPDLAFKGAGAATVGFDEESHTVTIDVPLKEKDSGAGSKGGGDRRSVKGEGYPNYVAKWIAERTISNSQIYDDSVHIGIGTTSPAYKLDVNGTGNFTGGIRVGSDSTGYTLPVEDGETSQILTTDGEGDIRWVDVQELLREIVLNGIIGTM